MSDELVWPPKAQAQIVKVQGPKEPKDIVSLAKQLTPRDMQQIAAAFQMESYEMASTFVWSKAIAAMKKQLATIGMEFVGEMLGRPDLADSDSVDRSLTDYEVLRLSEDLGFLTPLTALRMRQTLELLVHLAQPDEGQGDTLGVMEREEAIRCLRACVEGVLKLEPGNAAISFVNFRKRLESSNLKSNDDDLVRLLEAPYFFKKTTMAVLLTLLKSGKAAALQHAGANTQVIVPLLWAELKKPERWQVGHTYAEVHNAGRAAAVGALGAALSSVKGFDYVPENLRSNSFRSAASRVVAAHYGFNNFHNEAAPMRELASMGSAIPMPALDECVSAALICKLGNPYGHSYSSEPYADELLKSLSDDQWIYYLDECLPEDRNVLDKIDWEGKPLKRWCAFAKEHSLYDYLLSNANVDRLLSFSVKDERSKVAAIAKAFLNTLGYQAREGP